MSAIAFSSQLSKEWEEKQKDLKQALLQVNFTALFLLEERSPVKTGKFKSNWLVSIGGPDHRSTELPGNFAAENQAKFHEYLRTKGYPELVIQNNVPYASELENGKSNQAPHGMVGLTIAEIEALFDGRVV